MSLALIRSVAVQIRELLDDKPFSGAQLENSRISPSLALCEAYPEARILPLVSSRAAVPLAEEMASRYLSGLSETTPRLPIPRARGGGRMQ